MTDGARPPGDTPEEYFPARAEERRALIRVGGLEHECAAHLVEPAQVADGGQP